MSIIPLISSWERYLDTHPTGDLREFGRWLQEEQPGANTVGDARHSLATNASIDTAAAATLLIARLHLINHFLSKPVIRKLGFSKDSEFSVLLQVFLLDKPNKKELCRQLLIENSTGVEITRRLAKKGLLRETADPNDRRSARLSLTEKGHRLLKESYAGFREIHIGFLAPLPADQQQQLVTLLTRLHDHHSERLNTAANRLNAASKE